MVAGKGVDMTIKKSYEEEVYGDRIVLYFDCGGVYTDLYM